MKILRMALVEHYNPTNYIVGYQWSSNSHRRVLRTTAVNYDWGTNPISTKLYCQQANIHQHRGTNPKTVLGSSF